MAGEVLHSNIIHSLEAVYESNMDLITETYLDSSKMIELGKFDELMLHSIHMNAVLMLDNMKTMKTLLEALTVRKK